MGRSLGSLAKVLGLGLWLILLALVVALGPAMVVDRGADGAARISAFPMALVVLDPLVWRCVRNSVAIALMVTFGSLVVGTTLGTLLGRRRFWGRQLLGLLAGVPVVFSPIWIAPGVVAWLGGESSWDWLAARSFLGQPGDDWARWLALGWVGLVGGTPPVILATRLGLARVNPAWADAARVVGAGRLRVWLDVSWPTIRPDLARVAGAIFTLSLVEPAGPIILGLRRTLAVEMVDAALRADEPNRAATLAVIAVAVCLFVQGLVRRWGGPVLIDHHAGGPAPRAPRAGVWLGAGAVLVLLAWAGFALGPVANFTRRLGAEALGGRALDPSTIRSIVAGWLTPETQGWAINSAVTATLAVGLDLVILAILARGGGSRSRWWTRPFALVPPLAVAVGALAIPSLLAAWAAATGRSTLAAGLDAARTELSPGRSPGFLLVLVLAAVRLPGLAVGSGRSDPFGAPQRIDAALLVGASTRQARRIARGSRRFTRVGPALMAWCWASTDLASAWVLTALLERRTLAPAALGLIDHGAEPLDPRLLGLFLALLAIRLIGLAVLLGSIGRDPAANDANSCLVTS